MKSLFSVSRLIGRSQTRFSKHTSSVKSTFQENEDSQSQKHVIVDSTPFVATPPILVEDKPSKVNSSSETLPKEQDISFPPTPSRKTEDNKTQERKTETLEEPGYDVVLQPSAKASFGDWTELDTGSRPAEKAFDADSKDAQFGIDKNVKGEQSLARVSDGTNWTPLDVGEKVEEPLSNLPSDPEWLQLDTDKKTKEEKEVAALAVEENRETISETRVKEERVAHLEEMRNVREEKEKLTERVKELEEELHQAERKLQLKMEQISNFVVDLDRKGEEIKALNEEKDQIQQVAEREKAEFLDEIRSNEAIAAKWQVSKEVKDVEMVEMLAKQDNMQDELDNMIGHLSKSRSRVAELESASELQVKKLLEQDATSASQNDAIEVLKGQKARLIALVHTLRTNAKINERQNSMLMVQLKQQSDNLMARGIPKSVRRSTGPVVVEQAVRTIKALNDEIYQIAASLTDCVDEIEKRFVDESDGTAAALETLKSLLGTEIYAELDEQSCYEKDNYNPYILQIGFQACLTACCMRIITSWYPAEPEYGKFLEAVYERIRGYGELPFFDRPIWVNWHHNNSRWSRERGSMAKMDSSKLHLLDQYCNKKHFIRFHR
jgi:hypothetical protein